jgi:WxL domain surface cell wall-binding
MSEAARERGLAACAGALLLLPALITPAPAWGSGELKFGTAPRLPTLPAVTINARSQTPHATMSNFSVSNTLSSKPGWNLTVAGQSGTGKSAVFAQYCPAATCGSDTGPGYVAGGATLAAGSLTLNSTSASFTGGTGGAPTLQCSTACNVDSTTAVKIASAAAAAGEGTWTTTGFSASSLTQAVPTTLKSLPAEEIYRVNILWTLSTGP